MSKQLRETRKIELVETHNIALSLDRLTSAPYDNGDRWRRALYHALAMARIADKDLLTKIRIALDLP
jgi:hypothetical protein